MKLSPRMIKGSFLIQLMLQVLGCGSQPATHPRAIQKVSSVTDTQISVSHFDTLVAESENAQVGFDESGQESRLLIHLPEVENLWNEDVITSSIAGIELLLACRELLVNPDNIILEALSEHWTPFSSWKSRNRLLLNSTWAVPGGTILEGYAPINPSVHSHPRDENYFELSFDVTPIITKMIREGVPNYGYRIRVEPSVVNAKDKLDVFTVNNPAKRLRPTAILTFSTNEDFLP